VLSFAQVDAVEEARDYFSQVGGKEKSRSLTIKLANKYVEFGKNELSVRTFRLLINDWPDHRDAPMWQDNVVAAYYRLNDKPRVFKETRRMLELYGARSPWAKKNADNRHALDAAYEVTEGRVRELVTNYHHEAQKTKSDETTSSRRTSTRSTSTTSRIRSRRTPALLLRRDPVRAQFFEEASSST